MDETKKSSDDLNKAQDNLTGGDAKLEPPEKKGKKLKYVWIVLGAIFVFLLVVVAYYYYMGGEHNYVPPEVEKKDAELQVLDDLEYISSAIETYNAQTLQYPISLSALVPNYLDSLPKDPFTGKPYIYESDEHTYYKITVPDPSVYNLKELYVENGQLIKK